MSNSLEELSVILGHYMVVEELRKRISVRK
jgi:hypothetical protein